MKSIEANDRRLVVQGVSLCILILLPFAMIAVNGSKAFYGILSNSVVRGVADDVSEEVPLRLGTEGPKGTSGADEVVRLVDSPALKDERDNSMLFGVYDPSGEFEHDRSLRLRHVYVSWASFDRVKLTQLLNGIESRGHEVMVTIEPWPVKGGKTDLLPAILAGGYDRVIDELAEILSSLNGPVYVSWGHEMDQDLTERYPWSGSDPKQFVLAYQYVVDRFRRQVDTELRWIWAGVLKEGSQRYWPGAKYADFIGMPIYSYSAWDQKTFGYIRDFRTTFEEKLRVAEKLEKPLLITELGVSGSSDFESFWLHQAFMSLSDYDNLKGIVYFYSKDADGAWGSNVATPDWRVHPDSIRGLVEWSLGSETRESEKSHE
jgi:beta-mannanase